MADRYAISAGTWDASDTTIWSATDGGAGGASAPTVADAVILNGNSGVGTITIGAGAVGLTLVTTGYAGTIAFGTNSISLAGNNATIYQGAATFSVTGTPVINCTYAGGTGSRSINAGAPTEANSISFNISAGTDTVAVAGSVRSLNFAGFTGTYPGSDLLTVYGDLTYVAGMTVPASSGSTITFAATSGTKTITSAGKTIIRALTFNGVGGTWQFQDNFTADSSRSIILTNGTLDCNGKTLTSGVFFSNNTNTRALLCTGATFVLLFNNDFIWRVPDLTGFTITGRPNVQMNYSGATGTRTIQHGSTSGGTEADAPDIAVTAGTDIIAITAGSKINNLTYAGFTGTRTNTAFTLYGNLTYSAGMTLTAGANALTLGATSGTKTITSNGQTLDFPITVNGTGGTFAPADALVMGATRTLTLTNGTLNFTGFSPSIGLFALGAGTKTLTLGTGTITVLGAGRFGMGCGNQRHRADGHRHDRDDQHDLRQRQDLRGRGKGMGHAQPRRRRGADRHGVEYLRRYRQQRPARNHHPDRGHDHHADPAKPVGHFGEPRDAEQLEQWVGGNDQHCQRVDPGLLHVDPGQHGDRRGGIRCAVQHQRKRQHRVDLRLGGQQQRLAGRNGYPLLHRQRETLK
jgi:hypothetical protein